MKNRSATPVSIWHTLQRLSSNNNSDALWGSEDYVAAVKSLENTKKSLAVLKKHLPKPFHPLIRFAQPKNIWYLNVQKGVTATQLNQLLDELCLRIAKDIGYAPRLKVMVKATQWKNSGLPLSVAKPTRIAIPSRAEAAEIIAEFLSRPLHKEKESH